MWWGVGTGGGVGGIGRRGSNDDVDGGGDVAVHRDDGARRRVDADGRAGGSARGIAHVLERLLVRALAHAHRREEGAAAFTALGDAVVRTRHAHARVGVAVGALRAALEHRWLAVGSAVALDLVERALADGGPVGRHLVRARRAHVEDGRLGLPGLQGALTEQLEEALGHLERRRRVALSRARLETIRIALGLAVLALRG